MLEISAIQIQQFTDLINQMSGTMGLTASESMGQAIALEVVSADRIEIQSLTTSPPLALSAAFGLNAPDTSECLLLIPEECLQRFLSIASGDLSDSSIYSLNENETNQLNEVATSIVRGFALGLGNYLGDVLEIDSCTLAIGENIPPPVFAREEYAIQLTLAVSIPDYVDSSFQMLFTPQFIHTVTPEEDGEETFGSGDLHEDDSSVFGNNFLDEDSIAGMLSELETMGKVAPANASGGHNGHGNHLSTHSHGNNSRGIDLILDISLDVTVELGRVRMLIKDVLELAAGSIIELDRVAGEPVDVLVNGRLIAKGEVVVIEDNFGIRLTEIISPAERAMGLGRR
jgi:flagellar motor switch protein FliN/FliY